MRKLVLFLLLLPSILWANNEEFIKEANDLFDQANELALKDPDQSKKLYRSAIVKYQKLIDDGLKNPHLYTNLGNAHFFAGDKGRALLSYHRAYRLNPSDENLNHNIEFLRTQTVDVPPGSSSKIISYIFFWHGLSFQARLVLFIIFNCLFWGTIAFRLYHKDNKLNILACVSLVVSLAFFSSLLTTSLQWDNSVDGIVTEREVTPRQGNGYIYEMALSGPLHSGAEFALLETRKNWLYIELPGGSKCWIPKNSSTLVEE